MPAAKNPPAAPMPPRTRISADSKIHFLLLPPFFFDVLSSLIPEFSCGPPEISQWFYSVRAEIAAPRREPYRHHSGFSMRHVACAQRLLRTKGQAHLPHAYPPLRPVARAPPGGSAGSADDRGGTGWGSTVRLWG